MLVEMFKESRLAIAAMTDKLEDCRAASLVQVQFTARLQAQNLRELLLPEPYDIEPITSFIEAQQQRLSREDRWENRNLGAEIQEWLQLRNRPLLWLSGQSRKNRISWLSPFSLDFASALSLEPDIAFAYVFCDTGTSEHPDVSFVAKCLVSQLLQAYPKVAIDHLETLSMQRFRNIGTSAGAAGDLLFDVLSCLKTEVDWPARGCFLIIDQVDQTRSTKNCNVMRDFLPALQRLGTIFDDVNIILTSSIPAEQIPSLEQDERRLMSIATGAPRSVPMRLA